MRVPFHFCRFSYSTALGLVPVKRRTGVAVLVPKLYSIRRRVLFRTLPESPKMSPKSSVSVTRRAAIKVTGAGAATLASPAAFAQAQTPPKTFLLVHGAWHGGWCWRRVA